MDKALLSNATSSDESPTPGYMLTEISRATISSYQACRQLEEFLVARIKKANSTVKYKCLVVIRHVCRTGRVDFKRDMAQHIDVVKECLQYRGNGPDPLLGDEPNKRVREAAKEAMDAIFDSQLPTPVSAVAAANRIQGMGGGELENPSSKPSGFLSSIGSFRSSDSTSAGASANININGSVADYVGNSSGDGLMPRVSNASMGYNGGDREGGFPGAGSSGSNSGGTYTGPGGGLRAGGSGMVGLGNPNFKDPREEKSWMQRAQDAVKVSNVKAEKLIGSVSSAVSSMTRSGSQQTTTFAGRTFSNGGGNADRGMGGESVGTAGIANFQSNRGPNAFGLGTPAYAPTRESFLGNGNNGSNRDIENISQNNGIVPDIPLSSSGLGRAGAAASDGQYEQTLIASLCDPAGLKPVPPEEALEKFLATAPTLSPDVVGACLEEQLNSDYWQSRVKALLVLSSLATTPGCEAHIQLWQQGSGRELICGLVNDPKASVRTQALKTSQTLQLNAGGGDAPSGSVSGVNSVSTSKLSVNQVADSLIDFGYDTDNNNGISISISGNNVSDDGGAGSSLVQPSYSILRRQVPPSPAPSRSALSPSEDMLSFTGETVRDSQKAEVEDIFAGMSLTRPVPELVTPTATATLETSAASTNYGSNQAYETKYDAADDSDDMARLLEQMNGSGPRSRQQPAATTSAMGEPPLLSVGDTSSTTYTSEVPTSASSRSDGTASSVDLLSMKSAATPSPFTDLLSISPTPPPHPAQHLLGSTAQPLTPEIAALLEASATVSSAHSFPASAGTATATGTIDTRPPAMMIPQSNHASLPSPPRFSQPVYAGMPVPVGYSTLTAHPGLPSQPQFAQAHQTYAAHPQAFFGTHAGMQGSISQPPYVGIHVPTSSSSSSGVGAPGSADGTASGSGGSGFSFLDSSSSTTSGALGMNQHPLGIAQGGQGVPHVAYQSGGAISSGAITGAGGGVGVGQGIIRGIVPQTQQSQAPAPQDSFSFVSDMMKTTSSTGGAASGSKK